MYTTLVSVDGNNGPRGALTRLPDASPETITEETPSATVTPAGRAPTQGRLPIMMGVVRLDQGGWTDVSGLKCR
jgi:hypothetical protein